MNRNHWLTAIALVAFPIVARSAPARDPGIAKLAKAALSCPFEEGAFSEDCPGFQAWADNEPLFADGKGNDTIFSMLGDPDVKVRVLATKRGVEDPKTYFADKGRAAQLLALAAKETDIGVARSLAWHITWLDAEKLGLGKELRALAKHPVAGFRQALSALVSRSQSAAAMSVVETLLEDADREVRKSAVSSLSTGGITPGVEPVCKLLTKQLKRTDDLIGEALWAGSSSKCPGMDKLVLAELASRTADPSKVTNAVGIEYSLAASGVCKRTQIAEEKKAGFAIGKRLADSKVRDPNTRRSSLAVLVDCGGGDAAVTLGALAKDKDAYVAKSAVEKLAELKKK